MGHRSLSAIRTGLRSEASSCPARRWTYRGRKCTRMRKIYLRPPRSLHNRPVRTQVGVRRKHFLRHCGRQAAGPSVQAHSGGVLPCWQTFMPFLSRWLQRTASTMFAMRCGCSRSFYSSIPSSSRTAVLYKIAFAPKTAWMPPSTSKTPAAPSFLNAS